MLVSSAKIIRIPYAILNPVPHNDILNPMAHNDIMNPVPHNGNFNPVPHNAILNPVSHYGTDHPVAGLVGGLGPVPTSHISRRRLLS
jgi:hypothetical protein